MTASPDASTYGLLVLWGDDARMFVVHSQRRIGWLIEFCRQRYGIGDGPLELAEWSGRVYKPAEYVPWEGTALTLRRA